MATLRVLCEIPDHPFRCGEVVDATLIDHPNERVAHGWAEWVERPTVRTTATAGAPETTAARTTRPPAAKPKPKAKPEPAAKPKPAPEPEPASKTKPAKGK
jgi:hypothetical protein